MHVKCCEGTIYEEDLKHTGEKTFMRLWCLNWDVKDEWSLKRGGCHPRQRRHHIKMPIIGTERNPASLKHSEQDGEQHEMNLLK